MESSNLKCLISREEIESTVKRLAADIRKDLHDKYPLVVGVLKGSFVFLADLVRAFDFPHEVEFVRLSSYGSGRTSTGQITMIHDLHVSIEGRHVLVVEDIVDTGNSIAFLMKYLSGKKPASLKLCTLTEKPSRRQTVSQTGRRANRLLRLYRAGLVRCRLRPGFRRKIQKPARYLCTPEGWGERITDFLIRIRKVSYG